MKFYLKNWKSFLLVKVFYLKKFRLKNLKWSAAILNYDLTKIWGSEFSSYEIELRNRVTQNDVTLRVTILKVFKEIFLSSYFIKN